MQPEDQFWIVYFKDGWLADVYTGKFDPRKDAEKLDNLVGNLQHIADSKQVLKSKLLKLRLWIFSYVETIES